jgi:hypothetical protein
VLLVVSGGGQRLGFTASPKIAKNRVSAQYCDCREAADHLLTSVTASVQTMVGATVIDSTRARALLAQDIWRNDYESTKPIYAKADFHASQYCAETRF